MVEEFDNKDGIYDGVVQLIGAIFRLCAQDMKYGDNKEVLQFVRSDWFVDLCEYLGLNPKEVRKRILTSKKIRQRMEYH